MSLPIVLTEEAQTDVAEAFEWYESLQAGTGDAFLGDLQSCLAHLGVMPELYGRVYRRTRAAPLDHHKYVIYYRVEPNAVVVTAIQHAAADPQRWRRRKQR